MNVEIPLKVARRLLEDVLENPERGPASVTLTKAIARAEALLVPRPWKPWTYHGAPFFDREWPHEDVIAARVRPGGWFVQRRGEYAPFAQGPETGIEGQRLADQALAAYCKRQGVTLPASWFLP